MSRGYRSILRHGRRRGLPSKAGFSRRDILKLGAMGAASALLAPALSCRATGSRQKAPAIDASGLRVAIVGAGFGGLACAHTLASGGADVTVFEAQDHAGGRVATSRSFIEGKPVELGGEFIGTNHPTWIGLAEEFDLELEEVQEYEGESAIILGDRLIQGETADALYEEVDAALAGLIEMARPIDPIRPWTSPNAAELDRQNLGAWIDARQMSDDARRVMHTAESADNGVPTSQMSLLGYLAVIAGGGFERYYEESETHRLSGGNDRLAQAMSRSLGERVKLGTPVSEIQRMATAASVTTAAGERHACDAIVLAIAPSVWDRIRFDPPLPETLRPQMGKNTKLLLSVTKPVWEEAGLTPELLTDGPASLTWVSADGGRQGPHSFTLFSGADAAEQLRNRNSSRRAAVAIESLRPAYPNLADHVAKDTFLDWPGHPQVRASYSFPAPGEITTFGQTLVEGLSQDGGRLYFAGEHTSYGFIGYMEGALSSGVRTAVKLAGDLRRARSAPETRPATTPQR